MLPKSFSDPAFRRGAVVIAALFLNLGLLYGIWYSYSVYLVALSEDFGWSRSVVAGAMSLFILAHGVFGPFAGRLVESFGPRRLMMAGSVLLALGLALCSMVTQAWQLYLSFGLISAVGLAACGWVPSVIVAEKWFPKQMGTALGVVTAGIGVGMIVVVPVTNMLIEGFDWRVAFRVQSFTVLAYILPVAFLVLREPSTQVVAEPHGNMESAPNTQAADLNTGWTVGAAVRARSFHFAVLAFFTGGALTQLLIMHQFAFMVDHGVAKTLGSIIVGVIGVASIPGKIIWGSLSDRIGRELAYTLGLACILVSVVALGLVGQVAMMPFVFAFFVGIGYSANAPIIPSVARDLFAGPRFPSIFGTLSMFAAMGGATGSWLGGFLFDLTGAYQAMLITAATLALFAPAMLWLAAPRRPQAPPVVA